MQAGAQTKLGSGQQSEVGCERQTLPEPQSASTVHRRCGGGYTQYVGPQLDPVVAGGLSWQDQG